MHVKRLSHVMYERSNIRKVAEGINKYKLVLSLLHVNKIKYSIFRTLTLLSIKVFVFFAKMKVSDQASYFGGCEWPLQHTPHHHTLWVCVVILCRSLTHAHTLCLCHSHTLAHSHCTRTRTLTQSSPSNFDFRLLTRSTLSGVSPVLPFHLPRIVPKLRCLSFLSSFCLPLLVFCWARLARLPVSALFCLSFFCFGSFVLVLGGFWFFVVGLCFLCVLLRVFFVFCSLLFVCNLCVCAGALD